MASLLDEVQERASTLVERVGPAVVGLGRGWGVGSGVVVGDGRVLTNAHNLRGSEVTVSFADGRRETATVAGVDADLDVAAIAVDTGGAPAVDWPSDRDTAIGAPVFALANPGGRGLRATLGFVSAVGARFRGPRGRRIPGTIEHTAPLPRGSSGGPLIDAAGGLLGLNTARIDGGLIVAVPADAALRERVDALFRGETHARPRLGVAIAPPHVARRLRRAVGLDERDGLLVRAVRDGSPADRAGIERGDLIVALAGSPVSGRDDLFAALDAASEGDTLALTVVRATDEREVSVTLAGADD